MIVPDRPPAPPAAASMLLALPVRPEQLRALTLAFAHYAAVRCQRAAHHTVNYPIADLLAETPLDDSAELTTTWTLGPLTTTVAVAVRYQAARPKEGEQDAALTVQLYRRSDDELIDETTFSTAHITAEPSDATEYPARIAIMVPGAADDPRPLDVTGEAGEDVDLIVAGEDVRILSVTAYEIWPAEV